MNKTQTQQNNNKNKNLPFKDLPFKDRQFHITTYEIVSYDKDRLYKTIRMYHYTIVRPGMIELNTTCT